MEFDFCELLRSVGFHPLFSHFFLSLNTLDDRNLSIPPLRSTCFAFFPNLPKLLEPPNSNQVRAHRMRRRRVGRGTQRSAKEKKERAVVVDENRHHRHLQSLSLAFSLSSNFLHLPCFRRLRGRLRSKRHQHAVCSSKKGGDRGLFNGRIVLATIGRKDVLISPPPLSLVPFLFNPDQNSSLAPPPPRPRRCFTILFVVIEIKSSSFLFLECCKKKGRRKRRKKGKDFFLFFRFLSLSLSLTSSFFSLSLSHTTLSLSLLPSPEISLSTQ